MCERCRALRDGCVTCKGETNDNDDVIKFDTCEKCLYEFVVTCSKCEWVLGNDRNRSPYCNNCKDHYMRKGKIKEKECIKCYCTFMDYYRQFVDTKGGLCNKCNKKYEGKTKTQKCQKCKLMTLYLDKKNNSEDPCDACVKSIFICSDCSSYSYCFGVEKIYCDKCELRYPQTLLAISALFLDKKYKKNPKLKDEYKSLPKDLKRLFEGFGI